MPDWNNVQRESVQLLIELIRFNTTNPPGNERPLLDHLATIFQKEGLDPLILETAPNRGNLIVRLKGNGNKRPILLNSHVDVVPADANFWDHPPFSGHLDEEGYIWGRGAVDMKQMTVMNLMLLLLFKRQHKVLDRDLVFVAVSDEEAGCHYGSEWLVNHQPELIDDCEYGLNEVGGFSLYLNDRCYYPIQVAEKGYCWLRVRATGTPGHGSMPIKDNAIVKMARAIDKIGSHRLPYHKTPVVEKFIRTLAQHQKVPVSTALEGLLNPKMAPIILDRLLDEEKSKGFAAMLHNTASPTIVNGGNKVNVIPPWAEFEIDGRLLPGQNNWNFIDEVQKIIGPGYSIEIIDSKPPAVMDTQNKIIDAMTEVLKIHDPGCIPVPYMAPGFTDSKLYSQLGIQCYGFCPMKLDKELVFSQLFHGHNERISQSALLFGIQVLYDLVQKI